MILLDAQKRQIEKIINGLFYNLKARLLGRFFTGPAIFFEVLDQTNPMDTLEGAYNYTYHMLYGPGARPNAKRSKILSKITGNYVEAERLKTLNRIMMGIEQASTFEEVKKQLDTHVEKATGYIKMLVTTEVRNIQANAEREGIEKLGASIGVDDPTVVKLGVIDGKLCHVCTDLWHLADNVKVPKAYKLSELQDGYSTHKNPIPTVNASHPHCRHVMTMISPGFGFNASGKIDYIGYNYDVYNDQRGVK
jgi:hypothetical protein